MCTQRCSFTRYWAIKVCGREFPKILSQFIDCYLRKLPKLRVLIGLPGINKVTRATMRTIDILNERNDVFFQLALKVLRIPSLF